MPTPVQPTAEELFALAFTADEAGKIDEAIRLYGSALDAGLDPSRAELSHIEIGLLELLAIDEDLNNQADPIRCEIAASNVTAAETLGLPEHEALVADLRELVSTSSCPAALRITQLDCDGNPEVVTIQNLGAAAQNLDGWQLRSDPVTNSGQVFDLSLVGSLDLGEQASIFSSSGAPSTDATAGQFLWGLSFKFRNSDPTDFAQIVDGQRNLIDQLNCGEEQPLR